MSQPQQSPSRASTYYAKRRSQMSPGRPMSALYNNNNNNSGSASPPSASPGASSLVSDASTLNRNHHQQQQQQQNRMSVLLLSGVDPSTVLFSDMLSNSNNNINTQSSMSSPQDRHNATSPEELAALVSKQASELALKNKLVAELTNRNQWAMAHLHATSNEGVNMDNSNGGGEGNLNDDDDDNGKVVLMESVCVDHTHRLAQLAQLPALNQQESDEAKVKLLQTVLFFNKNLKQARLTVKEVSYNILWNYFIF